MKTLCIGIGNTFRCDDGAGIYIVRELKRRLETHNDNQQQITFLESSGEGSGLMDSWRGFDCVILFDAIMKQGNPGRIIHMHAENQQFPSDYFKYSSHAFSLSEAVELARVLDKLPKDLQVYGVEGKHFGYGETISADTKLGCEQIVHQFIQGQTTYNLRV